MTFDLKWLSRVEQTANLDKTLNPGAGMDTVIVPQLWTYNGGALGANDTEAAIIAANYFLGAYGYLSVGDAIYYYSNDPDYGLAAIVTSTSSGVTTEVITS
jgi:hypothetical protein